MNPQKRLNTQIIIWLFFRIEKENMLLNFSPAQGKHLWLVTLSA